jgi:hypothetical protein
MYMSVNTKSGEAECVSHYHIGCLASHSRQGEQIFEGVRDLAMVPFTYVTGHTDQVAGFGLIEADGFDEFFHILYPGPGKVESVRVACKQARRDFVHLVIGSLGGQNSCYQCFVGV